MKHKIVWAVLGAAFLAQGAAAQNATANSNQTATSSSGSASFGNVGNATTNNMAPTANSNSNATSSTSSMSSNNGNTQQIIFTTPPAQTVNGTQNQVVSGGTDSRMTTTVQGSTTQNLNQKVEGTTTQNQNVRSEQVISGEQKQYYEYGGSYTIKNVPNVNAPPLTSSNDTCMGSTSGGVAVAGFGLSGGSTYTDEHCKRIKMSRELWNKGMKAASLAMDCMDRDAREALELTGYVCPQTTRAQRLAAEEAHRQQQAAEARSGRAPAVARAAPAADVPQELLAPVPVQAAAPAAAPAPVLAAPAAAAPLAAAPAAPAEAQALGAAAEPPAASTSPPLARAASYQEPQEGTVVIRRLEPVEPLPTEPRQ